MDTELSELSRIRNNISLVKIILDLQLILKNNFLKIQNCRNLETTCNTIKMHLPLPSQTRVNV